MHGFMLWNTHKIYACHRTVQGMTITCTQTNSSQEQITCMMNIFGFPMREGQLAPLNGSTSMSTLMISSLP